MGVREGEGVCVVGNGCEREGARGREGERRVSNREREGKREGRRERGRERERGE